jgi:hypothetical protein
MIGPTAVLVSPQRPPHRNEQLSFEISLHYFGSTILGALRLKLGRKSGGER